MVSNQMHKLDIKQNLTYKVIVPKMNVKRQKIMNLSSKIETTPDLG